MLLAEHGLDRQVLILLVSPIFPRQILPLNRQRGTWLGMFIEEACRGQLIRREVVQALVAIPRQDAAAQQDCGDEAEGHRAEVDPKSAGADNLAGRLHPGAVWQRAPGLLPSG